MTLHKDENLHFSGLKFYLLQTVKTSSRRLNFGSLVDKAHQVFPGLAKGHVRSAIRTLVDSGELKYSYHFGQSWLEYNYSRPIALSSGFVLVPDSSKQISFPGKLIIRLASGSAFGMGDHPTTRLAMEGLNFLSPADGNWLDNRRPAWALDIGTGTGILALAAARLGLDFVNAFDIDSCARFEARRNVELNCLSDRIFISSNWPENQANYMLVMANLRFPTIKQYHQAIADCVVPGSFLIVSGIRPHESGSLKRLFEKIGFLLLRSFCDGGWWAAVFRYNV